MLWLVKIERFIVGLAGYEQCDIIVDDIVEWFALRWTKSMMKAELRSYFKDINTSEMEKLISRAKKKIRKLYGIDPKEYKGRQIAFYELILRDVKIKVRNKLTAAERLDKLFGLEKIQGGDPETQARLIREQIAQMKASMNIDENDEEIEDIDGGSETTGQDKTDSTGETKGNANTSTTEELEIEDSITDDNISEELLGVINNIRSEEFESFQNRKKDKEHNGIQE